MNPQKSSETISSNYQIKCGIDYELLLKASRQWNEEKAWAIDCLMKNNAPLPQDEAAIMLLFSQYGLTDFHWDWTQKAIACSGEDYLWMFLVTPDDRVQAITVIYHPKCSVMDGCNIFYIDYIATAYWNRSNDRKRHEFPGAARKLIASAIRHIASTYGYRPGFGLHSLPTATSYYEKLGMIRFDKDPLKENLFYYEAAENTAMSLLETHDNEH